ncbi:MAG TPA: metal-dependent hydrolase [Candidatus Ozemobacteraceae bacterium]|nr:metal-dependent hydrolase [Candidatus Ozemobacteraceae bacterium]
MNLVECAIMNPITHALVGWTIARPLSSHRRDRLMITLAGILPDIDGLGLPVEALTNGTHDWYSTWHHALTHNLTAAAALAAILTFIRRWGERRQTSPQDDARPPLGSIWLFLACLLSTHLHLLGDLIGSKGPDGDPWPVPYFAPFSDVTWVAPFQWEINAWPNFALTILLLTWAFRCAWRDGESPIGFISTRADQSFVETLRQRFGNPTSIATDDIRPSC